MNNVEVVAQGKILINDFNSQRCCISRSSNRDLISFEDKLASFGSINSSDALNESALTCTVIADERRYFPRICIKVDILEYMDRSKRFVDFAKGAN